MKKLLGNITQKHLLRQWFAIGIIVLSTAFIYYNSLKTPFIFDDIEKIVENPDMQRLNNLKTKLVYPYSKQYYNFRRNDPSRPITYLTFTLNYYFGGLNTFGYHLFNLVVHILNAILIFFLTKKIILYIYKKDSIIFPFFVALFFAVHPINTEAATYIFERCESLATLFYFLALLSFIKVFENEKKLGYYIFSIICFILAIFSKETAVTLPAIILIFDYLFLSDYRISKVIDKKCYHLPYWIILIGYLSFRLFYLGGIGVVMVDVSKRWTNYTYLITQSYVIVNYIKLLLVPIGLCIDHFILPAKTLLELKTLMSIALFILIFILIFKVYIKKTAESKIILFSALWFFITLSPTSSFLPLLNAMADRRVYLPGFGFYLIIVFLYFKIFKINFTGGFKFHSRKLFICIIMLHILLLGYGTVKRNQLYQQPILMWQNVISQYPNNAKAHDYLGLSLYSLNRFNEAEIEYREAIKINPNDMYVRANLGVLLEDLKRYEEAEIEFREAIKINPDDVNVHNNLGVLLKNSNKLKDAEKEYREAIRINPNVVSAHYNLGILLMNLKRTEEAEKEYREAIRINPNNARAHNNLGFLLYSLKKYEEAAREYREAIRINPNDMSAHNNLGMLLNDLKMFNEAEIEYRESIKINPDDVNVHNNLGVLLKNSNKLKDAEKEYREAIRINPSFVGAHSNLGNLYYYLKEYDKSLQEFRIALKLSPDNKDIQEKIKSLEGL